MSGFELNKIAAAILLAGLVAMVTGTIAEALYEPGEKPEKRGYEVAGAAPTTNGAAASKEPEILKLGMLMASANPDAGKESAKKCLACHTLNKGEPNKIGPNLWSVVDNKKAHAGDFAYSDALKNFAGSKSWSYDELAKFLHNPKKFIPGTKMSFAGIGKPEEIANILAFLRTQADSPAPLPKPDLEVQLPQ